MAEGIIYALMAVGLPVAAWLSSGGAKYVKNQIKKYIGKIDPRKSQDVDKINDEDIEDIINKKSR